MVPLYDSHDFYKDYSLLMQIDSNGYFKENYSLVKTYPPPSDCADTDRNLDNFLRCLPSPGGGVTNVFFTPVQVIKYCTLKEARQKGLILTRSKNDSENHIASNLKYVRFIRPNATSPLITIDFAQCKPNDLSAECN